MAPTIAERLSQADARRTGAHTLNALYELEHTTEQPSLANISDALTRLQSIYSSIHTRQTCPEVSPLQDIAAVKYVLRESGRKRKSAPSLPGPSLHSPVQHAGLSPAVQERLLRLQCRCVFKLPRCLPVERGCCVLVALCECPMCGDCVGCVLIVIVCWLCVECVCVERMSIVCCVLNVSNVRWLSSGSTLTAYCLWRYSNL